VGKHRNHGIANIDDIDRKDIDTMISSSESKIDLLREKAQQILEKARNAETHQDKLPEIDAIFEDISEKF
jgi:fibrillarin-like rRNA methylase